MFIVKIYLDGVLSFVCNCVFSKLDNFLAIEYIVYASYFSKLLSFNLFYLLNFSLNLSGLSIYRFLCLESKLSEICNFKRV